MLISKYNQNLYFFITTILIIKLILLFVFPRELFSYVSGLNSWSYFSSMSFNLDMQSFRDGNHPGTPIYLLQKIFFIFLGNKIDQFYNYFYFNHLFLFLINFFSIKIFYNFFKKRLSSLELISFLLLFTSSFNFFIGLEIVDLISYQFSISLILVTYFFKSLDKNKIKKLSLFCAFAIACKMTFLPFVISIIISKIIFIIFEFKNFKKIFKFLSFFSLFYLLFNFPILGRIPKIFLDSIFLRSDTKIIISTAYQDIIYSINQIFYENILFFLIIIFSLTIFIFNLFIFFKKFNKKKKDINKELVIMIFSILITFFYIYTFIAAGKSYANNFDYANLERENILRNNYPYLIFILINFLILKNNFNLSFIKDKFLITFSILIFIITSFNYVNERNLIIKNSDEKRRILTKELSNYLDLNKDIIAVYTNSIDYGLGMENFFLKGNYIEGNEFFTKEILNLYPNIRHFRLDDIIDKLELLNTESLNEKVNNFKNRLKKIDIILYNTFPKEIYESLSYQTKNTILNKNIYRSEDIFSFQNNINYKKPFAILFYHPKIKNGLLNENSIFNYVNKHYEISDRKKISVLKDDWYLYILN